MNSLVTGGAGFIGSHLVDALLARGDEVTVVDDLSTGRAHNLTSALNHGARLDIVDVTDATGLDRVVARSRPQRIFHLAAQIDVRHAVADPARDATINLLGTVKLLEAARRHGVARFVLASTGGAIYGDADQIPTPETARPRPRSPYAASKAAAETYLELYRELHGLSTISLRLANAYGPRQAGGEAGVIAIFCAAAAAGHEVTLFGDGEQTRDFVYVADVVDAFVTASESPVTGCVNIATGRETSVLELAWALGLHTRPAPGRAGEVRRSCLDPSAAAKRLGWAAATTLADGLAWTLAEMVSDPAAA
jgi:UDP-glucose 4-epimerase